MQLEDRFYTSTEVAEILGVSLRSVYRYLEEDKIKAEVKTATGRHRFTRKNILDFLYPDGYSLDSDSNKSINIGAPSASVGNTTSVSSTTQPSVSQQQGFQSGVLPQQAPSGADTSMNTMQDTSGPRDNAGPGISNESSSEVEVDWLAKFRAAAQKHKEQSTSEPATQSSQVSNVSDSLDSREQVQEDTVDSTPVNPQGNLNQQPSVIAQNTVPSGTLNTPMGAPTQDQASSYSQQNISYVQQSSGQVVPSTPSAPVQEQRSQSMTQEVNTLGNEQIMKQQATPVQQPQQVQPKVDKSVYHYTSSVGGLKELAQGINRSARKSNVAYAFTLNAGLSLHKLIRPFSVLHIYAKSSDRAFFEKALDLTETDASNAQLCLIVDRDNVLSSTNEVHGLSVVSNDRLKQDLLNAGEVDLANELNDL